MVARSWHAGVNGGGFGGSGLKTLAESNGLPFKLARRFLATDGASYCHEGSWGMASRLARRVRKEWTGTGVRTTPGH